MSFLTPLFLIGLAGLAVPVLLHLIQRERKQVVQFPSLMFLRRIPYQSVRRRRIRHWLLLMMRLAALALIVLASRDVLPAAGSGASGTARPRGGILGDAHQQGLRRRWKRARRQPGTVTDHAADRARCVLRSSTDGAELA